MKMEIPTPHFGLIAWLHRHVFPKFSEIVFFDLAVVLTLLFLFNGPFHDSVLAAFFRDPRFALLIFGYMGLVFGSIYFALSPKLMPRSAAFVLTALSLLVHISLAVYSAIPVLQGFQASQPWEVIFLAPALYNLTFAGATALLMRMRLIEYEKLYTEKNAKRKEVLVHFFLVSGAMALLLPSQLAWYFAASSALFVSSLAGKFFE